MRHHKDVYIMGNSRSNGRTDEFFHWSERICFDTLLCKQMCAGKHACVAVEQLGVGAETILVFMFGHGYVRVCVQ